MRQAAAWLDERQRMIGYLTVPPFSVTGIGTGRTQTGCSCQPAQLGAIDSDPHGDTWIRVVGKGHEAGRVVLPPLARAALNRYSFKGGCP